MFDSYPSAVDFISLGISHKCLLTVYLPFFTKKIFHPGRVVVCPGLGIV